MNSVRQSSQSHESVSNKKKVSLDIGEDINIRSN